MAEETPQRLLLGGEDGLDEAELAAFERSFARHHPPEEAWRPRKVLLFSGHLVDAPSRPVPRFPQDKAGIAAAKIAEALDSLEAGREDVALTQGACGGDLLFAEECRRRGMRVLLLQPFAEPSFIERSVFCPPQAEAWRARYLALTAGLQDPPRSMPAELGPTPPGRDPYVLCNLWLLHTALSWGLDKLCFICLWNGGGGDGPGGTAHMHDTLKALTGRVVWLDTRQFC